MDIYQIFLIATIIISWILMIISIIVLYKNYKTNAMVNYYKQMLEYFENLTIHNKIMQNHMHNLFKILSSMIKK